MVVSSILNEVKDVIGKCDNDKMFRIITDAVRLANNQLKSDANVSYMDICVCDGCVTLPQDVASVLAVNYNGYPSLIRDQWYQYHANGQGSEGCVPCGYTDELGQVCTFKDPSEPVLLIAEVENPIDSNCELRVFGWDEDDKRIYTAGAGGVLEDGFLVPTVYGYSVANTSQTPVARIDRIKKAVTNGMVKLIAVNPTTLVSNTTIGHYQPYEVNPTYRRIRVGDRSWVRVKYRRVDNFIRSANDWINIENREAIILLVKAVHFRLVNQIDQAKSYELEGMRLLSNEADSLRPNAISPPQIVFNEGVQSQSADTLFF